MAQNNSSSHSHKNSAMPWFDMMAQHQKSAAAELAGPKTEAIGLKGPWHLNPGNPDFPNHRPYLSNIKAGGTPAVSPQKTLKFPGGT